MRFTETSLPGVFTVDLDRIEDDRGYFARAWCASEFRDAGLDVSWVQMNTARTRVAGTVRGLHLQSDPWAEYKMVWCLTGAMFDVAVDLRPDSRTRGHWVGTELSAENRRAVVVPPGFAHGYQTLTDGCEMMYLTSHEYVPDGAYGVRPDDPAFGIRWPLAFTSISEQDREWPLFEKEQQG